MPYNRPTRLEIGAVGIELPTLFPSISSIKTNWQPSEYLALLSRLGAVGASPQFLVSAFDLAPLAGSEREEAKQALRLEGSLSLMDSGNYESYWMRQQGIWTPEKFHDTLAEYPCDLVFAFDAQDVPSDNADNIFQIVAGWQRDQQVAEEIPIIPIVHGQPDDLPLLCREVARQTEVRFLAVAERDLGSGIMNRTRTVQKIRQELNSLSQYVALHLLGTGTPASIAVYSMAGADSFDGLEWCQTVVDHDTGSLHHSSHIDFFSEQTGGEYDQYTFDTRYLLHNLDFYAHYMKALQSAIASNSMESYCRLSMTDRTFNNIAPLFGWEIS